MINGRFRIVMPKQGEALDYDALNPAEKEALCAGITYNASIHSLYRISIAIVALHHRSGTKRTRAQKSYRKVNRVYIRCDVGSPDIQILGVYPKDTLHNRQTHTATLAGGAGGEERLKDAIFNVIGNTAAGVCNRDNGLVIFCF